MDYLSERYALNLNVKESLLKSMMFSLSKQKYAIAHLIWLFSTVFSLSTAKLSIA